MAAASVTHATDADPLAGVDLPLAPLDGALRVWLFKDVEDVE